MTETTPEPAPGLRDRLLATLTEFEAKEPREAVEAVIDQFVGYLRAQADDWHTLARLNNDIIFGEAAAVLCQGLADGIEAGRPVSTQDSGVQSEP